MTMFTSDPPMYRERLSRSSKSYTGYTLTRGARRSSCPNFGYGVSNSSRCIHVRASNMWLRRNSRDENLFGNTLACKRLEVLQVGFAKGQ